MARVRRQKLVVSFGLKTSSRELSGSVHILVVSILTIFFVSVGCYLYSVNQSAVQGYHMRTLEKEIGMLKEKNAELRIAEADLRSLGRIEASQGELEMQKLENVRYIEERGSTVSKSGGPVALK